MSSDNQLTTSGRPIQAAVPRAGDSDIAGGRYFCRSLPRKQTVMTSRAAMSRRAKAPPPMWANKIHFIVIPLREGRGPLAKRICGFCGMGVKFAPETPDNRMGVNFWK